jgi:hypothetical protein
VIRRLLDWLDALPPERVLRFVGEAESLDRLGYEELGATSRSIATALRTNDVRRHSRVATLVASSEKGLRERTEDIDPVLMDAHRRANLCTSNGRWESLWTERIAGALIRTASEVAGEEYVVSPNSADEYTTGRRTNRPTRSIRLGE